MLKPILLRVGLAAGGVVLALGVVEIALRVLPPRPVRSSGALDTAHASRVPEPDFRQRRYELRDDRATAEQRYRIVVVGDSFTWGARVHEEDAYPDRMATRLAKGHPSDRFEVVNFSRPGWNTPYELRAVRHWLSRLRPDALVVGYCLNDAEPSEQEALRALQRGIASRRPARGPSRFLHRTSRVYRLLYDTLENLRRRRALVRYYHALYDDESGWPPARRSLAGFRELAARRRIPFLLVVFPIFDSQLDGRYRYDRLHRRLRETAEELGIDLLDLLPYYRVIDARRLAADPFVDGHPSELAHRIAADAILDWWVRGGILPPFPEGQRPEADLTGVKRRRSRRRAPRAQAMP
jgi:lysophospholipase L1-like esterase